MPPAEARAANRPFAGLATVAQRLANLRGWRGLIAAAGLGILSVAALPPLYLLPFLWLAFPGILWLLDGATGWRRAFFLGWAFGFGHFAAGLYWVGHAFLVEAERFGAVMPFAVAALAAGMALYPALALLAVWRSRCRGLARVLLLGAAWIAAEWLRSWFLTGFPWNLIGTVWTFAAAPMQFAALAGVWGLSLITVLAAAAPACLADAAGAPGRRASLRWLLSFVLAAGLPLLLWAGGAARLAAAPDPGAAVVEGSRLRLVQPSIEQSLKWQNDLRASHVAGQMALSQDSAGEAATHVIWAETAVPFLLAEEDELRRTLGRLVPPGGALVAGAPRRQRIDGRTRAWNSMFALNDTGDLVATYDKRHLVPFGEYVPFRAVLGFAKLTVGGTDFSPGSGPRVLRLPGLPPASALICYESIFPGRVVDAGERPAWMLNITNDSWFGSSSGPYQHLASARLRTVEEGLPLVRVANSGISAVIDAYGRTVALLGLNRVGTLDAALPRPVESDSVESGATFFSRLGNWTLLILFCVTITLACLCRRYE
jgi:apolipoprotein N-acyltransferase